MARLAEEHRRLRQLHHLAEIHHAHPVADEADDGEVVGDEEDAERVAALDRAQHVEDLRLDRHVERGHWLVGDQQLGIERERAGEADALALPAAELVGVALRVAGIEADRVQQLAHPLPELPPRHHAVRDERLGHDVEHRPARVE